ncbi:MULTISPECIES: LysR family transcriptional regulator [Alphaproteobacteria]|uniref:LysR family transcriptional regulator n=2 Tax=Alphaproteobacteria TaxID=28211 RepID=A0A512HEK9_9HYPH|nr:MULTISPECIES: LysR family transcriptional regulator [Alphaproteobacteria]GEO83895.1 LysR family transcriptional regulator [Ciceribacter naphthalenivorans]GLR21227.1 LysR family transcriptional regulator [Ciceribacter naphthalenivorans]GLT04083.1 LysR family transcriptional regulator [Sphingomonas psychrolutea]
MKRDLNWDYYRSFLAVISEGSLSGAARALGLTQPTVGRHIDALEAASGEPLFLRTPKGLLPTQTALQMLPHAETMAATVAALNRAASGNSDRVSGTVRISASEVIAIEVLPPILARLQDQYPELTIELSPSDEVEDLLNQAADIAIRMLEPNQDALISQRIGGIPLGFYAHRDYLERHGTPESLADLSRHRLIGFDRPLAYVRSFLAAKPDLAETRFAFRSDSNLTQFAAIRAAGGIGICQEGLARRFPDLVSILPGVLALSLDTYVVMHENLKTAPRCRVTFNALVAGLRDYISR